MEYGLLMDMEWTDYVTSIKNEIFPFTLIYIYAKVVYVNMYNSMLMCNQTNKKLVFLPKIC
jgi:hypothetical protein